MVSQNAVASETCYLPVICIGLMSSTASSCGCVPSVPGSRFSTPGSDSWRSNAPTIRNPSPALTDDGELGSVGGKRALGAEKDVGELGLKRRCLASAVDDDEDDDDDDNAGSPTLTPSSHHETLAPHLRAFRQLPHHRSSRPSPLNQTWGPSHSLSSSPTVVDQEHNDDLPPSFPLSNSLSEMTAPCSDSLAQSDDDPNRRPLTISVPPQQTRLTITIPPRPHPRPPAIPVEGQRNATAHRQRKKKPPCPRGGRPMPGQTVVGHRLTAQERRQTNRSGPEGMGDTNDGDDETMYQEDDESMLPGEEEPQANSASSSQTDTSSTSALPPGYIMCNNGQPEVLKGYAGRFLTTLAAGCQECLPESTTSTSMVANPIDVFRTLNNGFLPGTLSQLTKVNSDSMADRARLCADGFMSEEDSPHRERPTVDSQVLSTLTMITSNIIRAEVLEAIAEIIYWINAMHFAASIMRYVLALCITITSANRHPLER